MFPDGHHKYQVASLARPYSRQGAGRPPLRRPPLFQRFLCLLMFRLFSLLFLFFSFSFFPFFFFIITSIIFLLLLLILLFFQLLLYDCYSFPSSLPLPIPPVPHPFLSSRVPPHPLSLSPLLHLVVVLLLFLLLLLFLPPLLLPFSSSSSRPSISSSSPAAAS